MAIISIWKYLKVWVGVQETTFLGTNQYPKTWWRRFLVVVMELCNMTVQTGSKKWGLMVITSRSQVQLVGVLFVLYLMYLCKALLKALFWGG